MKEKKQSDVAVLLKYAGSYKMLTFLGLGLSAAAMVLGMAPYICIWLVARDLISSAPDWTGAQGIARYGWICLRLCRCRDSGLFRCPDVYTSGCIPHSQQHPQTGYGTSDEYPAWLL